MLPHASAITTFPRTVSFFKCNRPAGIFVKKLNSASEPTAMIGGTFNPKIRTGSSRTPPPTPVMPMSTPTTNPTRILAASKGINRSALVSRPVHPDEAFSLQVQDDFLGGFFGRQVGGVDRDFGVRRSFVRIGDPREFLQNARACLGIKPLSVALFADLNRRGNVHQDETPERL